MKINDKACYIAILVLSMLFLFIGNRIASEDIDTHYDEFELFYYTGIVTQVIERIEDTHEMDSAFEFTSFYIVFNARITSGERRGEELTAEQHFSPFFIDDEREIEVGDRILLVYDEFSSIYYFANYVRINHVVILGAVFLVLVLLFGQKKGFNAIVALGFTCMAIFWVFIPAILSGRNIYMTTIIVCIYTIVSTLLIVIGPNKKMLAAMLGCLGGVLLAGFLMIAMDLMMDLTGVLDQDTRVLLFLPTENPINLRAIIFAGVILGAVGAIMDVAMTIASSLWEVKEAGGVSDFRGIFKSGLNIGKDILGTMLNTLILAYIGSSLSLILLISVHTTSLAELFNMEMVIVEFLRALVGSFGMLLAIPLTAGICGWLYSSYFHTNLLWLTKEARE